MYMPGRFRTGSSPSRTVMSFAVYAASAIRKALQIGYLRATNSVSERAVGRADGEAQSGRSLHPFSELVVLDRGRQLGGPFQRVRAGLRNVGSRLAELLRRGLRQVADGESQRFRRTFTERVGQLCE